MSNRRPDRSLDGQGGDGAPKEERPASPDPRSDTEPPREKTERDRAKAEIAAGDVADNLADFA
jgi:hypothetical protein